MHLVMPIGRLIVAILLCFAIAPTNAGDAPLAKGVLLVATDRLHGTSFSKTIILITQFDAQGAMGVAINRRARRLLKDVFPDLDDKAGARELYLGGPVHPLSLFALSRPHPGKNWISVLGETGFSGGETANRYLLQPESSNANSEIRAYAGYAGWNSGQLQTEVARGDWRVIPGDQRVIFSANPDELWHQLSKIPTELWI